MRYLVKLGELKQKIEYLEKQLSIIDENISYLKTIKSNIIWQGEASVRFNNYYDNYMKELMDMEEKTLASIKYLTTYYKNYGNEYLRMRKSLSNLSDRRI